MLKNFSFRTTIVALFILIYSGSILLFNGYFNKQQNSIQDVYDSIKIDDSFSNLTFKSAQDSLKAREILNSYSQAKSATNLIVGQTKIYSTIFIFIAMTISLIIFILIFLNLTKPLKELTEATARIKEGDYSIHLPENGLDEMKRVKQSFNEMSQELENVQHRLLESEKQMIWKEMSRVLAHEIKNPLTPIQLAIQRLEDKYYSDKEKFYQIFPESAQMVYGEIENLRNLVHSFSKFAKVSQPSLEQINLSKSISEILRPYLDSYQINLEVSDDCLVMFDKTHFYQIMTNLLQNSIDAIEGAENGEITISSTISHHYVILEISDNGIGIDDEEIARIFEPYFSKKKRGTGLGLALVKRLIESNNSHIRVTSKLNKGTNFELYIPQKERSK